MFSRGQAPTLTDSTMLVRVPTAIGTDLGETVVLLDTDGTRLLELNPVGSEIWDRIEHPIALGRLLTDLAATFGVDGATVRRDVLPFVQTLVDRRLVVATH